jgi:inositol transport system substrate-binding protein
MKKLLVWTLAVILLFLGAAASQSVAAEGKKDIVIGLSMSDDTQFLTNVRKAAEKRASELGVKLIPNSGQNQVEKQLNDMEAFITMKVDVIIFNPLDRDAMGEVVDKVKEAGIPLVMVNTFTSNENYDVYVGSPEEDAGKIQGEWIRKNLGESGNLVIMYGQMGHSGQLGRYEGLKSSLLDPCPEWKVIAEKTGEWKRELGQAMMEDWLLTYPGQINVVASQNDEMAMGALAALEASGKEGTISVLGIDASPDAIELVKEGKLALTVFQDSFTQGSTAVDVAIGLLEGKEYPKVVNVPFKEVNKDNADEFYALLATWE